MWFTELTLHSAYSMWLKIIMPKKVCEIWSTLEKLCKPSPRTHTHNLKHTQRFSFCEVFRICAAAEYTEIKSNCEPLSAAGIVYHMKHASSTVDTRQGCANWWKLDFCFCCCAAQAGEIKWLQTFTGEITLYAPAQNEMFAQTGSLILRKCNDQHMVIHIFTAYRPII